MLQDSTLKIQTLDSIKADYLYKSSEYNNIKLDGDTIYFKDYLTSVFNDSLPPMVREKSLFTEKSLVKHNNLSLFKREESQSTIYFFLIFIVVGFILALFFKFARSRMKEIIVALFSKNQLSILTKDGEKTDAFSVLPVLFVFLPIMALFAFFCLNSASHSDFINRFSSMTILGFTYLAVVIIYFVKIFIIRFFGWVFRAIKISRYYIQIHYNFDILLGLLLFLPQFCIVYTDFYQKNIFFIISLFLIVLVLVTRIIRSFYIIITTFKFSQFYLFFYLCIVELLPLILLYKLLFFKC